MEAGTQPPGRRLPQHRTRSGARGASRPIGAASALTTRRTENLPPAGGGRGGTS